MKKIILYIMVLNLSTISFGFGEEDEFSDFEGESVKSSEMKESSLSLSGFIDFEQGSNLTDHGSNQSEGQARDYVLANRRLRLKSTKAFDKGAFFFKVDFNNDEVIGESSIDIREAKFSYSIGDSTDLSVGRQVSTWGVGDLIFINDLFPKNWIAHFTGREMEMLKDPADSLRGTHYGDQWTFDLVATPKFTPDTTPTGCRFEVFDPNQNKLITNTDSCEKSYTINRDGNSVDEGELALSIKTKVGTHELSFYGYKGFYKSPKGLVQGVLPDNSTGLLPYYPKLEVIGISDEGQVGPGIFSFEFGHYNSKEDVKGDEFLIENSSTKYLVGYKMDMSQHYSFGLQFYQDRMLNYENYEKSFLANNPSGYEYRLDEVRNTYTLRLGYKGFQDTLIINWFSYIRPEDKDSFHKLEIIKRVDDQFQFSTGVNIFDGENDYLDRDFGMLKNGDNIYTRFKFVF